MDIMGECLSTKRGVQMLARYEAGMTYEALSKISCSLSSYSLSLTSDVRRNWLKRIIIRIGFSSEENILAINNIHPYKAYYRRLLEEASVRISFIHL